MKLPEKARLWRIYYTCRAQYPRLAAVDQGTIDTQIAVKSIRTIGIETHSNTDVGKDGNRTVAVVGLRVFSRHERRDAENEPTWWIEAFGFLEINRGHARIRP